MLFSHPAAQPSLVLIESWSPWNLSIPYGRKGTQTSQKHGVGVWVLMLRSIPRKW